MFIVQSLFLARPLRIIFSSEGALYCHYDAEAYDADSASKLKNSLIFKNPPRLSYANRIVAEIIFV